MNFSKFRAEYLALACYFSLHHEKKKIIFQIMSQHLRQQLFDIDNRRNFVFKFFFNIEISLIP